MNPMPKIDGEKEPKTPQVGRGNASIGTTSSRLAGLKCAVRVLGNRAVDRRTTVGKALAGWRDELISDLGGDTAISRIVFPDNASLVSTLIGGTHTRHLEFRVPRVNAKAQRRRSP